MTRPLNSRKPWQSNNAGCTSKNFDGLVFDIFKVVHFHLLSAFYNPVGILSKIHRLSSMFHSFDLSSAFTTFVVQRTLQQSVFDID